MIRTIDEILEKSEETRMRQEFDEFCTELLQLNIPRTESITPEELEERQREWEALVEEAKSKSRLSKPDEIYIHPAQFSAKKS